VDADDAAAFHRSHYVRESVVVGLAGAYDPLVRDTLVARLERLPTTRAPELVLQAPLPVQGRSLLAIDSATPVTGFRLGHPIGLTRNHPDWPAMVLALVALGDHRQSHGRLFRHLRTERGLNYGDYAYVEPFVQRGWGAMPEQGVLRRQPYFSLWIRPTSIDNGPFALKLALVELEEFVATGLLPEEFEDTRQYLLGRLPLSATDSGRRLAYTLDAVATGTPNPLEVLPGALRALTREQVNEAIGRHLRPADLRIVAVSGEAEALRTTIVEGIPTPIVYVDVQTTPEQAARDADVADRRVGVAAEQARVVPVEGIFR
jgi:zinc protease